MLIPGKTKEILLNYLGIIKGIIEKKEPTDFSIRDLLFEVRIKNSDRQIPIQIQNISNKPNSKTDPKYQSLIKELSSSLLSIKIRDELIQNDFFTKINFTIHKDLQPSPHFLNFTNKFINEQLEQVDFNTNDPEHKHHILIYINAPYNLFEKELKEIENQYKQFSTKNDYETIPLDLMIVIDASNDEEASVNNYCTKYIKDAVNEMTTKIRTNIFNDINYYDNKRLHIYYVSSNDLVFMGNSAIPKDGFIHAFALDMSLQYIVLCENISSNSFHFFCEQLVQFKDDKKKAELSKVLKRMRVIGNQLNKLPYKAEFSFDYLVKLIPCTDCKDFEFKSIMVNKLSGSLRTKEYLDVKKIYDHFYVNSSLNYCVFHLKTFSFVPGKQCSNCYVKFKDEDYQYYCYWCKIAFCVTCIEKSFEESNHIDRYFHKLHNLLYFKTKKDEKDIQDLDEERLGRNRFATESTLSNTHNALCNGCEGSFNERNGCNPRYVCISCRPGMYQSGGYHDFCYNCIIDYREQKGHWHSLSNDCPEHNEDHHIYLLLICDCGDYQDY